MMPIRARQHYALSAGSGGAKRLTQERKAARHAKTRAWLFIPTTHHSNFARFEVRITYQLRNRVKINEANNALNKLGLQVAPGHYGQKETSSLSRRFSKLGLEKVCSASYWSGHGK